jgi:isoleucyl-tRNA synthetase
MDAVRTVCSSALSLRKAGSLRVRQPLASLTVASPDALALEPYVELLRDEVNVKTVVLDVDVSAHCQRSLAVLPRALGPRLGGDVQRVIRAVKSGDWSVSDSGVVAGGVTLREGEYELRLVPLTAESAVALPGNAGVVLLDTTVTPELEAEGVARDVIRAVQQARRDASLDVSDRIALRVTAPAATVAAVSANRELVTRETLATSLELAEGDELAIQVARER